MWLPENGEMNFALQGGDSSPNSKSVFRLTKAVCFFSLNKKRRRKIRRP